MPLEGSCCCPSLALRSGSDLVDAMPLWPTSAGAQSPSLQKKFPHIEWKTPLFHVVPSGSGSGTRQQRWPNSVSSVPSPSGCLSTDEMPWSLLFWAEEAQCSKLFPADRMVLFFEHIPSPWLHTILYHPIPPVLTSPHYPMHGPTSA